MKSFPNKKYQIIYADPPWLYDNRKDCKSKLGGFKYPPMSDEEICALPVKDIADVNCALALWITMPRLLTSAPKVFKAWGFEYITCLFTWIKLNPIGVGVYSGLGHWVNGNAELCSFGKKGRPIRQVKNVKQIQFSPRGRHSVKPPQIRDEIVRLFGDIPRIELFARKHIQGWDVWGNEAPDKINKDYPKLF